MIATITFNPSLDYVVRVKNFKLGKVNRTYFEELYPGGKGINVAIMLQNLGVKSCSMGFVAGFTGAEIEKRLKQMGCNVDFISLPEGFSRINVKLKETEETEINAQGPMIPDHLLFGLLEKVNDLRQGDTLVLAGGIPSFLPSDLYKRILALVNTKAVRCVVDATGDLLKNTLPYHPFLIKPNKAELEELAGRSLNHKEEIIEAAKELRERGAQNVLVSLGGEGALLAASNDKVYFSLPPSPTRDIVNTVGSGDSMVAGFLVGYDKTNQLLQAFYMALAAGSASAFERWLASYDQVEKLYNELCGHDK